MARASGHHPNGVNCYEQVHPAGMMPAMAAAARLRQEKPSGTSSTASMLDRHPPEGMSGSHRVHPVGVMRWVAGPVRLESGEPVGEPVKGTQRG
jgi:hypothetical protein